MLGSIRLLVSYGSVRIVLSAVLALLFAFFYVRVLIKRRLLMRALSTMALVVFLLAFVFIPVENVFVRFATPEDAVRYSLPNQKVLKVLEHGQWATAVCKDKRTVALSRDSGGWKAVNPTFVGWGVRWGSVGNVGYQTRQLSDGVYYVGVSARRYVDEARNKGAILIDTITDTGGSKFDLFQTELVDKSDAVYATDLFYYAFVDAMGDGYHLVINGEEFPFD